MRSTRRNCDGIEVGTRADYDPARELLGHNHIIGALCGVSRHLAMDLAEAGADYVAFHQARLKPHDEPIIAWWSSLFQVPCVAADPVGPEAVAALLTQRPDFIRPPDSIWTSPEEARRIVADADAGDFGTGVMNTILAVLLCLAARDARLWRRLPMKKRCALYDDKDYNGAREIAEAHAKKGDARAMAMLGRHLSEGPGRRRRSQQGGRLVCRGGREEQCSVRNMRWPKSISTARSASPTWSAAAIG